MGARREGISARRLSGRREPRARGVKNACFYRLTGRVLLGRPPANRLAYRALVHAGCDDPPACRYRRRAIRLVRDRRPLRPAPDAPDASWRQQSTRPVCRPGRTAPNGNHLLLRVAGVGEIDARVWPSFGRCIRTVRLTRTRVRVTRSASGLTSRRCPVRALAGIGPGFHYGGHVALVVRDAILRHDDLDFEFAVARRARGKRLARRDDGRFHR